MARHAIDRCSHTGRCCKHWQPLGEVFTGMAQRIGPGPYDKIRESRNLPRKAIRTAKNCRSAANSGSVRSCHVVPREKGINPSRFGEQRAVARSHPTAPNLPAPVWCRG